LAKLRPVIPVEIVRLQLAHEHLDDIQALDANMKAVRAQIATLVEQTRTGLTDLYGVGPLIAGPILAEVEDIARFPQPAPLRFVRRHRTIDASSGEALTALVDVAPPTETERRSLERLAERLLQSLPKPDRADAWRICRLCEHTVCRGDDRPVGRSVP
jgi:hypothetical protein